MARRRLAAAFVIAFFPLTAQAQDDASRRLPYEPLPVGRTEIRYSLSRFEQSRDESGVKVRFELTSSTLGVAHGITDRLEIGAALPYFHTSTRDVEPVPGFTVTDKRHGPGDPSVYAAYALVKEADGSAGTTIGVSFKPNTSGGSNGFANEADVITPYVAVGKSLTPTLAGYLRYGYTHVGGNSGDSHLFTAGARQALAPDYGIGASLSYGRYGGGGLGSDYYWTINLWGYLWLNRQLALVPSVAETRYADRAGVTDNHVYQASLSLYYQF